MNKEYIVQLVWGGVVGAIVALAVVFGTGFAIRHDTADRMALSAAQEAETAALLPICAAQAAADPAEEERMAQLAAAENWERGERVRAFGWATMPGSESPHQLVADDCADAVLTANG